MRTRVIACVVGLAALFFVGIKAGALPNPLGKAPSFLKFNSNTVKGSSKVPGAKASAGQALLADGNSASVWGNVEGVNVASDVAGSPSANATVLTSDGAGKAAWLNLANLPAGSISPSSFISSPTFGNGSDGDVTISANASLFTDMYYNNLTINTGIVLDTHGFRIFVEGTCTLNGTISNNGTDPITSNGTIEGTIGGGSNGGIGGGSTGNRGVDAVNSMGGQGGHCGGFMITGGTGGTNVVPTFKEGDVKILNALPHALTCRTLSGALVSGGASGGGGDGAKGGAGGGGGGLVMIAARAFSGTGSIQANGRAGIDGTVGISGGGGGGGGGGCVVIVTTSALPATITTSVSGGAGGVGDNTPATAGAAGRVIVVF